ncbi:MAG: hypothetical protein JSS61_04695 [Verrucomicrobia bacterium]|nr:hypothetical protein [Verrucomicrobiota bacterium]
MKRSRFSAESGFAHTHCYMLKEMCITDLQLAGALRQREKVLECQFPERVLNLKGLLASFIRTIGTQHFEIHFPCDAKGPGSKVPECRAHVSWEKWLSLHMFATAAMQGTQANADLKTIAAFCKNFPVLKSGDAFGALRAISRAFAEDFPDPMDGSRDRIAKLAGALSAAVKKRVEASQSPLINAFRTSPACARLEPDKELALQNACVLNAQKVAEWMRGSKECPESDDCL